MDQSSSDSNKVLNMVDTYFKQEISKRESGKSWWSGTIDLSLSFMDTTDLLSKESSIWWYLLHECRYPKFHEHMFPSLPISGPLPTTDDEQGTESTVSDEERYVSSSSESD